MKKTIYPIITFVILQLLSCASLVLWIIWYVMKTNEHEHIALLSSKTYAASEFSQQTLILGILFLSVIIIASTLIFVEWLKAKMRYRNGSDFISGFTHELMTPLTCIQMNLETATSNSTISQEKKEKLLQAAFTESKKLQSSIDKILEIKIIEHRKSLVNLNQLQVITFFKEYFDQILTEWPQIDFHYTLNCGQNTYIKADKNALKIVLNNLIENAIKYSPGKANINVTISTHKKKLRIIFQDLGIGLQTNKLKKIFKIFYRENMNTRGSGLGLYISKHIIKGHKGKIEATSPGPGHGTTFNLTIPCFIKSS